MWQLDLARVWNHRRWIAGCRDWYLKYKRPWYVSPTGNKHDAIARVELALADYHCLFGQPLADTCPIDEGTGEVLPVVTIVTDNGGPNPVRWTSSCSSWPIRI